MKKSGTVLLGTLLVMAAASCGRSKREPEWTSGNDPQGRTHDTTFHGSTYRYYNHGWYPVYHGLICPAYYSRPYSYSDISRPGFVASAPPSVSSGHSSVSTGGFGHSSHSSGAGE